MNTINTMLGNVEVSEVSMIRKSAHGQYTIAIDTIFEGNKKTINLHSTDSLLFDTLTDLETSAERSEYLMENQKYAIETAVEDYINSL